MSSRYRNQYTKSVATRVSHSHLHDLECLYLSGVLDVRATAEIDEGTTTVDGAALARHELVNIVQLVFTVTEHLLEVLLGNLQSVETLLLLEDARRLGIKRLPVSLFDNTSSFPNVNIGKIVRADIKKTYPSGMAMS